ncbi:MAG: branched-chain amino acid ABC transporter permease [Thermoproteota archaeon]
MVDIISFAASLTIIFSLYLISALSLNLEYGFTGIPNFGKVAFQAIGAFVTGAFIAYTILYISGSSISIFSPEAIVQRNEYAILNPSIVAILFITSIILSTLISGLFGYIVSKPALRLREDYLALLLLIFGEVLRLITRNYYPLVGGTHGLAGIPNPFSWTGMSSLLPYSIIVVIIALLIFTFLEKLLNSPYGRTLKAIRENELSAQLLGKALIKFKGQVIMLGSAIAGLGGALYAFYTGYVVADDFIPQKTFDLWLIVILGGAANNKGILLGTLIVTLIDRGTMYLSGVAVLPIEVNYVRYIAVGALMLLILYYRPSGILSEKPLKTPAVEVLKKYDRNT